MGKKSHSKGFKSKGERPNVSKLVRRLVKRSKLDRELDILAAFIRGQHILPQRGKTDPWVTIDNPNTKETNKRRIKVRASIHYNKIIARKKKKVNFDKD